MKTKLLILGILCYFTANAQWYSVPSGTTKDLHDVFFIDAQTGYCVGGNEVTNQGIILKTSDAGETWQTIYIYNYGVIDHLVAYGNKIIAYSDLNSGSSVQLKSQNNGSTWQVNTVAFSSQFVQAGNDETYALIISNYELIKSVNGNISVLNENTFLYGAAEDQIVYINSTADTIFKSENGGSSFYALSGFPSDFTNNNITGAKIKAFNDTIVLYATYPARVHYSIDNGQTWNMNQNTPSGALNPFIVNENTLYGLSYSNSNSSIYATNDKGASWSLQKDNIPEPLNNIYFFNDQLGFAVGDSGTIYKTSNGGGLAVTENKAPKIPVGIYPNPSGDTINIEIEGYYSIKKIYLTDMNGKLIKEFSGDIKHLDISALAAGTYFLQIYTNQGKTTKKIVVVK